jgi:DUF1680 family protein
VKAFAAKVLTLLPALLAFTALGQETASKSLLDWAQRPPMGWNSWDSFGNTVTEAQTKAQADYMAANLAGYGWQYIVVDIQWYDPGATGFQYRSKIPFVMDEWGRWDPATNRFPSAANGVGMKALADYVHSKGLKFGMHLMRGIPRQAVDANTPIKGTPYHAADIADKSSLCPWNVDMDGVDMSKPGAQEYYNSVFERFASWGLDFIKVDDLSRPYHQEEIDAIRKAIDKTGRPIVFSTSPGATPVTEGLHIQQRANMWRISDDFWDSWKLLYQQFKRLDDWTPYRGPGHFPDADMLPLGAVRQVPGYGGPNHTRFTKDEQVTMMSLWAVARSPLMIGADLTKLDDFTLGLLTNAEVIAVNQSSAANRQLFRTNDLIVWTATVPDSADSYVALFNAQNTMSNNIEVALSSLGYNGSVKVRDLWAQKEVGTFDKSFAQVVPPHGSGLFRLSPVHASDAATTQRNAATQPSANLELTLQAEPFPLSRVRLIDGPFKDRQDINDRYLRMVEPDRLLAGFRQQAKLPAKADRYGGWEARDINGHGLGHYLSALSLQYAAAGEPWIAERISYIVDELAACQRANGDGYVLPEPKKVYEDIRAGRIKASSFSLNDCWVPNYTLHKVMAGLRDAYRLTGNKEALDVERQLADWLNTILSGLSDAQIQEMLKAEHGGMNEVLSDLSVDTHNPEYLRMAQSDFTHNAVLGPLMRGEDRLTGLHGNTQIPKLIGLAREYELTSDPQFRTAVETFWDSVVNKRSFAIGGHGESEHFFPPERFPNELTPHTCETCNTYNMLKLTGHLFSWEPKASEMDFVERALVNHLLANIGPEPGEFGYFLGLGSVGSKVFSTPYDSWWCCVGTGMENPGRYGEQIYFHGADTLWVNLFVASTLSWSEKGVTVRQETRFPDAETARFTFTCDTPVKFALKLRQPYWCRQPSIRLKGKTAAFESSPSSYIVFDRTWKSGDILEIQLPMSLRLEALPHSDDKTFAVMYGPTVLSGVVPPEPGATNPPMQRFSDHLKAKGKTDQLAPVFVTASSSDIISHLQPTGIAFAEFHSRDLVKPNDLTFVPFYRVYDENYAVYFTTMDSDDWSERETELRKEKERQAERDAATVDVVAPGFQQSEVDHGLKSENSQSGDAGDRKWRDARNGGWFSYDLTVDPKMQIALVCTYWGGEAMERNFDVLIDGEKVATQTLHTNKPGAFFDETYAVPASVTKGKSKVTILFQAHPGDMAGGLFGLRTVRAEAVVQKQ